MPPFVYIANYIYLFSLFLTKRGGVKLCSESLACSIRLSDIKINYFQIGY